MRIRLSYVVVAVVVLTGCNASSGDDVASLPVMSCELVQGTAEAITEEEIFENLVMLAHPAMDGRGSGSRDEHYAAVLLARELREYGFNPAGGDSSYIQSFQLSDLQSRNVLGFLPGTTDEIVVISAHFDHVGVRGADIYFGADDNASGTSAVLEVAEQLGALWRERGPQRRGVLVAFWGSEELGLVGSRYYVENPTVTLRDIVAVINLDMVGRNDPTMFWMIGAEEPQEFSQRSPQLYDIATSVAVDLDMNVLLETPLERGRPSNNLFRRTDSGTFFDLFADNPIPVIFLFAGFHDDYHQPTDTIDKINSKKVALAARWAYDVAVGVANTDERPVYQRQ